MTTTDTHVAGRVPESVLAAWEMDSLLIDGRSVHIRPVRPSDGPGVQNLHRSLSRESSYLRFFGAVAELSEARSRTDSESRLRGADGVRRIRARRDGRGPLVTTSPRRTRSPRSPSSSPTYSKAKASERYCSKALPPTHACGASRISSRKRFRRIR